MLALQRCDIDSLNQAARKRLRAEGALEPDTLHAAGRDYAVGDWIVTTRNDYRHHLINGQRGAVVAIDTRRRTLLADLDGHGQMTIPTEYLDAGHVEHAYALTIHKAQGLTCDRTYVLGDNRLYREAGYTALSRGRHHNRLYTIATQPDPEHTSKTTPSLATRRSAPRSNAPVDNTPRCSAEYPPRASEPSLRGGRSSRREKVMKGSRSACSRRTRRRGGCRLDLLVQRSSP